MEYKKLSVKKELSIDAIITIHYFEYTSDFTFEGESHDFWELVYVDKGEVEVFNGHNWQALKKGEVIFHKPMEFHGLKANGIIAPNLIVISFSSNSPAMSFFSGKKLFCNSFEIGLLASVIHEARDVFSSGLDDPSATEMVIGNPQFASLQLVALNLEHFLIDMYRTNSASVLDEVADIHTTFRNEGADSLLIDNLLVYFEKNLSRPLNVDTICQDNLISCSKLKQLFKTYFNCGVIEYFNNMRIDYAKQLIRSSTKSFSEISDMLGFNSIHYFSRYFKKITGMTPTEYSQSALAKNELSYSITHNAKI